MFKVNDFGSAPPAQESNTPVHANHATIASQVHRMENSVVKKAQTSVQFDGLGAELPATTLDPNPSGTQSSRHIPCAVRLLEFQ